MTTVDQAAAIALIEESGDRPGVQLRILPKP